MIWKTLPADESLTEELRSEHGLSEVLARLLAQRGIGPDQARQYLRPKLDALQDPLHLHNLEVAAQRIGQAIDQSEDVVIFGDYDVDGITSTVQLVETLQFFKLAPRFYVPLRMEEGYGLSREAMDRVLKDGRPNVFIALDCGTNAHEPIAYLQSLGIEVIIVDHHQAKDAVPEGCVLVNPHVEPEDSEASKDLCTAGLVFKLIHGFIKLRREAGDTLAENFQLKELLDLAALGTVADLVSLTEENRILSWFGLRHMQTRKRPGLQALAEVSGIAEDQAISGADLSFRLGPRINASGRLADASLPVELFLSQDVSRCQQISRELDSINSERQDIERAITSSAEERAEHEFADAPGIVLYDAGWHPGVVGIVASRVSRHCNKPCVILGAEGSLAKGSGRSIDGVDLVQVFQRCDALLGHWGGHPMAAGISLESENVSAFTARFTEALSQLHPNGLPEASMEISTWMDVSQLNTALLDELDCLHPYGRNNSEPIFGLRQVILEEAPKPFGKGNFRFRLPNGSPRGIAGIAWKMEEPPPSGASVDLALRFGWNFWRGAGTPQITLLDWRVSQS
ncbi:MAG: single-stranded-DNA-specific exonuclease RecJ [Coraliomargaritaceae bacterium]